MQRAKLLLERLIDQIGRARRQSKGDIAASAAVDPATEAALLIEGCQSLLAETSVARCSRLADHVLTGYRRASPEARAAFLEQLALGFSPDPDLLRTALTDYDAAPSAYALTLVSKAAEAPRQEILRRLNQSPLATAPLVAMRADLLDLLPDNADLRALEADFVHLLRSWFNPGFLVMRPISWSSPADLLERIMRYEAVHSIHHWSALRDRLLPADRRCYGFFHPAMGDEPLIFVEVALADHIPASITEILTPKGPALDPHQARVALFYSISNCQRGLARISFGELLIKQVLDDLASDLPGLTTFATLSPIPGLNRWIERAAEAGDAQAIAACEAGLTLADWPQDDPRAQDRLALAARYFLEERDQRGRLIDPVARFHVGNGARVERLCWMADLSAKGLEEAGGLMVNYVYDLDRVAANQQAYDRDGTVAAGGEVHALLRSSAQPERRAGRS